MDRESRILYSIVNKICTIVILEPMQILIYGKSSLNFDISGYNYKFLNIYLLLSGLYLLNFNTYKNIPIIFINFAS